MILGRITPNQAMAILANRGCAAQFSRDLTCLIACWPRGSAHEGIVHSFRIDRDGLISGMALYSWLRWY